MNGSQSPIFELFDTTLAATMPELIGVWTTHANPPESAVDFTSNADAETGVDIPLWRANFPSDLSKAAFHVNHSEAVLIQSQQALATAVDRVQRLIQSRGSESNLAFALPSADEALALPEQELLAALRKLQTPEVPTSYDIGDAIVGYSQQAFEQFQAFVERLLHIVAHYAYIETQIEGRTLARTTVGWSGDVDSIWQSRLTATQISLHERTVALTLASRDALLKTFSLTAQTALKLSVLVSLPGGLIFVLPVAWQFIDQIMTQARAGLTHEHI